MHMRYFKLPRTLKNMVLTLSNGSKLPPIGFGTSTGTVNEEELTKALDTAIEVGYRHIDSAFVYQNETVVGKVLQKWFKSGKLRRNEIFVTTKLPPGALYPDKVDFFIKKSLSNLQLDHVDLYLIHFPVAYKFQDGGSGVLPLRDEKGEVILHPKSDHVAVWKKMEEQVGLGRTRYIGLSNYNIPQIETVLNAAKIKPSCLQIELHVYLQQPQLVEFCNKNDIVVVGFSPLGSRDHNRRMKSFLATYEERQLPNLLEDETVKKIAEKYSKSVAQVMLRFLVQRGVVPIPKSMNQGRIKENFEIFDFELDANDVESLRKLDVGEPARISDFRSILKGIDSHPEYPFGKL